MKLVSISDIHILNEADPFYEHLIKLMSVEIGPGDILVLAGDIFDFLVGKPKDIHKRYPRFFETLKRLGIAGAQIHYIEGNHDFHLKKVFAEIPGCQVHSSEVILNLGKKRFYIAHGDLVDQSDSAYLGLRRAFRSPLAFAVANVLPDFALQIIGQRSNDLSQLGRKNRPTAQLVARIDRTRKTFREFVREKISDGFDFIILGHCHDADEITHQVDGRTGHYMNVGYPKEHRNYIRWNQGEERLSRIQF